MPRGVDSTILATLGQTQLAAPILCARLTLSPSSIYRWGNHAVIFDDVNPAGGGTTHPYEARLISVTGIDFSTNSTGQVTISVSNIDGAITTLDKATSFQGAKWDLLAYDAKDNRFYLFWSGFSDEISSLDAETAVFIAFPLPSLPNVQLPKTVLALPCKNRFANFANWNNSLDFDGSECPCYRTTNIGFYGNALAAIDGTSNPVTFTIVWQSNAVSGGALAKVGENLTIDSEILLITAAATSLTGSDQSVTCARAQKGTTIAAHLINAVIQFQDCTYTQDGCTRRGMYGNNSLDTYTYIGGIPPAPPSTQTGKRNYFGGYPYLTGFQYGRYVTKAGSKAHPLRVVFSGNDSAYQRALPIVYGRARVADPILIIAKPEGNFLTTLWAVSEGVLATNPADNSQSGTYLGTAYTPNWAFAAIITAQGFRLENIFVNGESRHDTHPNYGIEVANGDQDRAQPAGVFFPTDPPDFINNNFPYWGTARFTLRINTTSNPSVDIAGGQVTGSAEVQFGKVHRVYTSGSTFVLRATDDGLYPGANPAMVILDLLAAKRGGAGLDYARFNLQSFYDASTYCSALVTDTFFGGNVKRWTFNGVIDQRKSLQEWLQVLCLGFYCLPPYIDGNGLIKIRMLKQESTSGVPVFSSNVADARARNIVWNGNKSSLVKSRLPASQLPNEVRVNWVDKSYNVGFSAKVTNTINTSNPATIHVQWGSAALGAGIQFRLNDKITIDNEILWVVVLPAAPDGGGNQTLIVQRGYNNSTIASHAVNAIVQFWDTTSYGKISVTVADRDAQTQFGTSLADQTVRVMTKVVDLPGTTTFDEASRIATLILRAGEFGQGGLANNLQITFNAFYRDCEDLEIGDIIQVEDPLLDPVTEAFFRVLKTTPQQMNLPDGTIAFGRQIYGVLHSNSIYDDTALTVSSIDHGGWAGASDVSPDPVTGFAIVETGVFDSNSKPMTNLDIVWTAPSPLGNFRSLLIFVCSDSSGTQVGDWQLAGEITTSGQNITYPVTGDYRWIAGVSRPLSGHTPDVDELMPDGSYKYPRLRILVDGYADSTLPAPTSLQAFPRDSYISLTWDKYAGSNAQLCKRFFVYRTTTTTPPTPGVTAPIASTDTNWFHDDSPTVVANPTTTYYYWVLGVSILENVVINGVTLNGLGTLSSFAGANAGTDTAIPNAPTIGVVRDAASFNTNEATWDIGIVPPVSPTNWDTIESWTIQISTDNTFATFPTSDCVNQALGGRVPPDMFTQRFTSPGTFYARAKVTNIFGDSPYSNVLTIVTDSTSNITPDSDVPSAPASVQLLVSATTPISGNAYQGRFNLPSSNTNMGSYWGYGAFVHSSSTLPSEITSDTGSNAAIVSGSNVMTDLTKSWAVNQWIGYDLVMFSPKRSGSPQWDLEDCWWISQITGNTANTITFNMAPTRQTRNETGLKYYIVQEGVNHHIAEQVKWFSGDLVDPGVEGFTLPNAIQRIIDINLGQLSTAYLFVFLENLWGYGQISSAVSASSAGLITQELFGVAAGAGAVTAVKTNIVNLGSVTLNLGTVQTGLLQTSSSGQRVTIDSTNGLLAYNNSGVIGTQIWGGSVSTDVLSGYSNATMVIQNLNGASSEISIQANTSNQSRIDLASGSLGTGSIKLYAQSVVAALFDSDGVTLGAGREYSYASGPGTLPSFTSFYASSDANPEFIASYAATNAGGASFQGRKARNTHASPADAVSGDAFIAFLGTGYSGGSWLGSGGMVVRGDNTSGAFVSGQAPGTRVELKTNPTNGSGIVAFIIDSNQVIYMGSRTAASTPASFAANYYLHFKDISGNDFYLPAMAASW